MTEISKEAIEAARKALRSDQQGSCFGGDVCETLPCACVEAALKAAAPFMQQGFLMHCKTCGTITDDSECDCTAFGDDRAPLQKLMPYTLEELKQSMKADKEYAFNEGIESAAKLVEAANWADSKSDIMTEWDQIRHEVEIYYNSDLTRLRFEYLLEGINERTAAEIRKLKRETT